MDALRHRRPGTGHAAAVGAVLDRALGTADLEGFHRGVGEVEALRSRLLRMWADYEDAIAAVLAEEAGRSEPDPGLRLAAAQLIAIARSFTSPEVRELARRNPAAETEVLRGWLARAVAQVDGGLAGALSRDHPSRRARQANA